MSSRNASNRAGSSWTPRPGERTITIRPVPEVFDPRKRSWKIQDDPLAPHTSVRPPCAMHTPLRGGVKVADAALHESLHVRYSPPHFDVAARRIGPPLVLAAEDARIHAIARHAIRDLVNLAPIDDPATIGHINAFSRALKERSMADVAAALIAYGSISTIGPEQDAHPVGMEFDRIVRRHINAARRKGNEKDFAIYNAIRLAARAIRRIAIEETPDPFSPHYRIVPKTGRRRADHAFRFRATLRIAIAWRRILADLFKAALATADPDPNAPRTKTDPGGPPPPEVAGGADALKESGTMTIETPTLAESLPVTLRGRSHRSTDSGGSIRRPDRFRIDGGVFRRRLPRRSPTTILCDNSGSMSLTPDALIDLLRASAGATVAIYSGDDGEGTLRVIADRGRSIPLHDDRGYDSLGGNVIDYPAIRWLSQRPGRRVLISDGGYTGRSDRGLISIRRAIRDTIRTAGIEHYGSIDEFKRGERA